MEYGIYPYPKLLSSYAKDTTHGTYEYVPAFFLRATEKQ